jgi:hypothetical protein
VQSSSVIPPRPLTHTPAGLPTAPRNLSAVAVAVGVVRFAWLPAADEGDGVGGLYVSSYLLRVAGNASAAIVVSTAATAVNISALTVGALLTASVAAVNPVDAGPYTDPLLVRAAG